MNNLDLGEIEIKCVVREKIETRNRQLRNSTTICLDVHFSFWGLPKLWAELVHVHILWEEPTRVLLIVYFITFVFSDIGSKLCGRFENFVVIK